jgi:hypothetical protein
MKNMTSEKDNVSQSQNQQEARVEDLPVDEKQQDQVKGGGQPVKDWIDNS